MSKSKLIIVCFVVAAFVFALVTLFILHQRLQGQEYFIVESVNLTYEKLTPVLYVHVINTGETPIKIEAVEVYYEVPDIYHYVGMSGFVEETKYTVSNPLIILYGSNPIPPKHDAIFKAVLAPSGEYLDEDRILKPGTYIVKVVTEKGTAAFNSISVINVKKAEATLQGYSYEDGELIVDLKVRNVGNVPLVLLSNNVKAYVDNKPWKVFFGRYYLIAPGEEMPVQASIPLKLIPYSNIPKEELFGASMLEEHTVTIDILGSEIKLTIPPINIRGKVLDIENRLDVDARGQLFWRILSVKLEVISEWIAQPDLGWFKRIAICTDSSCNYFVIYRTEYTQEDQRRYIVTIYPSEAFYPAFTENLTLRVYYGELEVASAELS